MNPIELLEAEICKYIPTSNAVLVNSGTSAIKTGLIASGISSRDIIITTPFTFPHSAILNVGATPFFVDIDEDMGVDPVQVEKAIKHPGVAGVLAVHLFGEMCQIEELAKICGGASIPLFEDASQAFTFRDEDGVHAGTWGEWGAFSGYATKNFHMSQGGFLITEKEHIARNARAIRNHGLVEGDMVFLGDNYMPGWINAFMGWQNLLLHKPAIEAELRRYGPEDHKDIYSRLVYHHPWYQNNPDRWLKLDCPVAEEVVRRLRE